MNNRASRIGLAIAASACLLSPAALTASPAFAETATTAADCTAKGGVWVVVDTAEKTVAAGCATEPKNGLDALRQIDVKITEVPGKAGFICELNSLPKDACATDGYDAKTKSYWSYWTADKPEGKWAFSQKGANESKPVAGHVEGWRWGDGSQQPRHVAEAVGQKAAASSSAPTSAAPAGDDSKGSGMNKTTLWTLIGAGVAAVAALVVWAVRRGRQADNV